VEFAVAQQQKQIEALTATVRKVSERVELRAPAPQIAANDDGGPSVTPSAAPPTSGQAYYTGCKNLLLCVAVELGV
jgi:hypothetical protein